MVANLFKTVQSDLPTGSLPTALRKVMKEKFGKFDEYQLAKYNKSTTGPKVPFFFFDFFFSQYDMFL